MLGTVHHLGYWVGNLDAAIARQDALFGAEVLRRATSDLTGGHIAFVRSGQAVLEFMERPGTAPDVLVFDHVAYEVDDLDALVARLRAQGVQFDQEAPVPNAGRRAIWTRGATSMGVRLQLIGE
jgi:catechol 2,3-dioxygenase-like lactoylglutathione lyase family enzyme